MKAYDFCKFFDFTFDQGLFTCTENESYSVEPGVYRFIATDDQGTFCNRYANDVNDFIDSFESMENDYCIEPLETDGFVYDENINVPYYKQAYDWIINTKYEYTYLKEVIAVFSGNDTLTV